MKVALVGLSHPHSAPLLATLANLAEISEVSLCSYPPEERHSLSALPKCAKVRQVTESLDRILSDASIQIVVVCVRHDHAAAVAGQVLAAGKHLIVEKPVGIDSSQIGELIATARKAKVLAAVLYPRRLHPCAQAARGILARGELGGLICLEGRFLATQVKFRNPESWLFQRRFAGGGILLWLGCHYLDLLQYVSGDEVVSVGAHLATRSGERIDVEDCAALSFRFRSGAVGTFQTAYALAYAGSGYVNASGYDAYLAWNGTQGRVVWPSLDARLQTELPSGKEEKRFTLEESDSYAGVLGERFFRDFFQAVEKGTEPPTALADAYRVSKLIEAAEASHHLKKVVDLG